tara:strand:- start:206 stop:337 length:132 start_codon:yes stop_codon:yes gene_type:complete
MSSKLKALESFRFSFILSAVVEELAKSVWEVRMPLLDAGEGGF